ncbi:hypothetical protein ACET3Z_012427 [Daucus carota]
MATNQIIIALLFIFALHFNVGLSTSQVLKGSVSCLDCRKDYDLSGIKIALKCKQANKMTTTYTNTDGSFETALPSDTSASTVPSNCLATVLGGPEQLYTKKENIFTTLVKIHGHESSYTISNPLSFYTSCPLSHGKCGATNSGTVESSKTFELPPPGDWGLPPAANYIPFFPIIGIP